MQSEFPAAKLYRDKPTRAKRLPAWRWSWLARQDPTLHGSTKTRMIKAFNNGDTLAQLAASPGTVSAIRLHVTLAADQKACSVQPWLALPCSCIARIRSAGTPLSAVTLRGE